MIDIASLFGLLGSITAASLFFPQVWKSYKTKKTQDLSWFGIIIGMLNGLFWIVYGLFRTDPFIYATNLILFIGAFLLMILKRKYG
jgi:MtN3 and saliva related transmembrane protein